MREGGSVGWVLALLGWPGRRRQACGLRRLGVGVCTVTLTACHMAAMYVKSGGVNDLKISVRGGFGDFSKVSRTHITGYATPLDVV